MFLFLDRKNELYVLMMPCQERKKMKISVVIPFYNSPVAYFRECIESVKKLNPYEVILVDDCSTDERVIQIAKDSGCVYIRTQYQSGFDGHPFNVGVQNAKGDYICRVDSDDILLELPTSMKSDIRFGQADRVLVPKTSIIEELILAPRAILNGMVIRKELLLKYPSSEDASVFGDVLLVLRLIYNQYSHDFCETTNYIYRKRQGSIQTSKPPFYHRLRLIQTVARFCQLENIDPKQSIRYLELAMLNVKYGSKSRKVLVKNQVAMKEER
jgi:glycosyltransferase involved in cell wall biosynthesis